VIIATHDFRHIIELADQIAVIIQGELKQYDSPQRIFYKPPSVEVARFVGFENIFQGKVLSNINGVATIDIGQQQIQVSSSIKNGEVNIYVRPENVILSTNQIKSSARNNLMTQIKNIKQIGPIFKVDLDNGLSAFVTKQSLDDLELYAGKEVFAAFKATSVHMTAK
jgi:molybdopterin-binding protein